MLESKAEVEEVVEDLTEEEDIQEMKVCYSMVDSSIFQEVGCSMGTLQYSKKKQHMLKVNIAKF